MSETFRSLDPNEIQNTLLQFMGENMGELKKLDSSLIAKNQTLQGMTLDPRAVLRSVPPPGPGQRQPPPIEHVPIVQQAAQSIIQQPHPTVVTTTVQNEIEEDPNQLMFEFVTDLKKDTSILETIKEINKKVNTIERSLAELNRNIEKLKLNTPSCSTIGCCKKKSLETE